MGWFTDKKRLRQLEHENTQLRQENTQLRQQDAQFRQENTQLRQDNTQLQGQVAALESEKARLLAQLAGAKKNSTNSSKPPSSDIVKPPGQRRQKDKRRRGGQPGHPRQERPLLPPEQVDHFRSYQVDHCPVHGTPLTPSPTVKEVMQQAELVLKPVEITQHERRGSWCARCQQWHWPELPAHVQAAGLMGPRLTALAGYVKSRMHVSYTGVADFFDEVLRFKVCRGYLTKVLQVLGVEFDGVLGCDFFSAYRKPALCGHPSTRGTESGAVPGSIREGTACHRACRHPDRILISGGVGPSIPARIPHHRNDGRPLPALW